ncbi:hypothetical protein IF2G_03468 [Cordyceps javanica]|nr:hypothetical protein IF2G_03468 [Cordyceps javanica]
MVYSFTLCASVTLIAKELSKSAYTNSEPKRVDKLSLSLSALDSLLSIIPFSKSKNPQIQPSETALG